MNSPYTPHEWSPELWVGMLGVMSLFVIVIAVTFIAMVHRAGEHVDAPETTERPKPVFSEVGFEMPAQRSVSRARVKVASRVAGLHPARRG